MKIWARRRRQLLTALCMMSLWLAGCGGSSGTSTDGTDATFLSAAGRAGQNGLGGGANGNNDDGGGPRGPVSPGNGNPFPFPPGGGDPGFLPEFILYATESPPGPQNGDATTWGGVIAFLFAESGGAVFPETAIAPDQLEDPAGIAFHADQVFVGNRHGNNFNDGNNVLNGPPGSITRFDFNNETGALTPAVIGPSFDTNGPVHQINFSPSGELYVATLGSPDFPAFPGGIEKYTFDNAGNATLDQTFLAGMTTRGVIVSPDATCIYVTQATSDILVVNLSDGIVIQTVTLPDSGTDLDLHYMDILDNELYVASINDDAIIRFDINADQTLNPIPIDQTTPAPGVSSVAFSPDGLEMYGAGHTNSNQLLRFERDNVNDPWTATTPISTASLGGLLVLPVGLAP